MNPNPSMVHVNTPLTSMSVAFMQNQSRFIADQVFPNIPVNKQSDRYYIYDRGNFNRDEMKLRAPGTETAGGTYTVDNTPTYYCDVYGFHHDIPDQRRANSDTVLEPDLEAVNFVSMKALIKREILWVSRYFADSIWANKYKGVSTGPSSGEVLQWNNENSDPVKNVVAASTVIEESTGFTPNTLVVSKHVLDALETNPEIIDRIKYGQTPGSAARPTYDDYAKLFKVEKFLVARAIRNTAAEGLTNSHSFIAGKHALLCYSAPSPGIMTPSAGYTFSWRGYERLAGAQGQAIRKFRMENLRSDRVEIEMTVDQKVVAADLGFFFLDIVA